MYCCNRKTQVSKESKAFDKSASKIHYGAIDEKSSHPSYKNNRYTPRDDPPLNYINNYEVKCIYRINMNNNYKNINIYNYKKKFNI